jgi:hypothetical protein
MQPVCGVGSAISQTKPNELLAASCWLHKNQPQKARQNLPLITRIKGGFALVFGVVFLLSSLKIRHK